MREELKKRMRELACDDSGVALAYTVVVFLFFFMLCVSVYSMTENVRQKMELQNVCDAAAYSGAVVQADMLSRMAVLNRALSWTYLHTNRRQMDYLVGEWANQVHLQHTVDAALVQAANIPGCGLHGIRGINYYASDTASAIYTIKMMSYREYASSVGYKVSAADLIDKISTGNTNMTIIMNEQARIRNNIQNWIHQAVEHMWERSGMASTPADMELYLNGTAYSSGGAATYFNDVTKESDLLAFDGFVASDMGAGQGIWWNLTGNIQRSYNNGLVASYITHSEQWVCDPPHGIHTHVSTIPGSRQYIRLTRSYSSLLVKGTSLDKSFFGKAGSIVVAAKRPMVNPFTVIFGSSNAEAGLYGAFNGTGRDMWAVSASRAGVRLKANQGRAGYYQVQYPGATASGYTNGVWNLCEEDWDGVLIPVSRAWNETGSGSWTGAVTSGDVLSTVRSGLNVNTTYNGNIGQFMRH